MTKTNIESKTKKHDVNGEDLYLRACQLQVFIDGLFHIGKHAAIPGKFESALIPFMADFMRDFELYVYDELFWDKCDD